MFLETLFEIVEYKNMKFSLPPEITLIKTRIEDQWVYTFRYKRLGIIGRLRLKGTGNNTILEHTTSDIYKFGPLQ